MSKVYVFENPEIGLSVEEMQQYRELINEIALKHQVFVSTDNQYFMNFKQWNSINVINKNVERIKNPNEQLTDILLAYPVYIKEEDLKQKIIALCTIFAEKFFGTPLITNKLQSKSGAVFLTNIEYICVIIMLLNEWGLSFETDLLFDDSPYAYFIKALNEKNVI